MMGRTKKAEKVLLEILRDSPKTKKVIRKAAKAKNKMLEKKHLKKALERLCKRGEIVKTDKDYSIASSTGTTAEPERDVDEAIPIAQKLRSNAQKEKRRRVMFSEPEVDLDEEIKRLEMELEVSDGSDSDSEHEQDNTADGGELLSLSKYAEDRVEQLPASCLPLPGRYDPEDRKSKKKKGVSGAIREPGSGLKAAVKELLEGYQARSSEKLPFYCRFCSKQYNNETDFFNHKQTEVHKTAVAVERKATYCRLCRKQLTSPEQMKEHLSSKPHKECLKQSRNYQRTRQKHQQSGRQWV